MEETRVAGVCQRENDFYVGTVLDFRDRRYEYKRLNKQYKGELEEATVCLVSPAEAGVALCRFCLGVRDQRKAVWLQTRLIDSHSTRVPRPPLGT